MQFHYVSGESTDTGNLITITSDEDNQANVNKYSTSLLRPANGNSFDDLVLFANNIHNDLGSKEPQIRNSSELVSSDLLDFSFDGDQLLQLGFAQESLSLVSNTC